MLESIVSFEEGENRPWIILVWAFFVTTIGLIIAMQIAPSVSSISVGIFSVIFTIIPCAYLLHMVISRSEKIEEKDIKNHLKKGFLKRHGKDIIVMLALFAGVTIAFAFWSFALPDGTFTTQVVKINEIRGAGSITGNAIGLDFSNVFLNNIQVMLIAFIFALIFGAGAIFVIVWNASILGVFIGTYSKSLWELPLVGISFLPHGIPEIAGYLFAGLAGGLLSAAILRKNPRPVLESIAWDAAKLLTVGIILVFIGAGIEVFF